MQRWAHGALNMKVVLLGYSFRHLSSATGVHLVTIRQSLRTLFKAWCSLGHHSVVLDMPNGEIYSRT